MCIVGKGHGMHEHENPTAVASDGASKVGFAITLALFLHKAPEAAAYGTFILHKNPSYWQRISYIGVSLKTRSIFYMKPYFYRHMQSHLP